MRSERKLSYLSLSRWFHRWAMPVHWQTWVYYKRAPPPPGGPVVIFSLVRLFISVVLMLCSWDWQLHSLIEWANMYMYWTIHKRHSEAWCQGKMMHLRFGKCQQILKFQTFLIFSWNLTNRNMSGERVMPTHPYLSVLSRLNNNNLIIGYSILFRRVNIYIHHIQRINF